MSKIINNNIRTLLLYNFQIIHPKIYTQHFITPLCEMKTYSLSSNNILASTINFEKVSENRKNMHFDRYVMIYTDHISNARRKRLINLKRQSILNFINQHGQSSYLYTIKLNYLNEYVPTEELINQIKASLLNRRSYKGKIDQHMQLNKQIYFPYNSNKFTNLVHQILMKHKEKSHRSFQQTYLSIRIANLYQIKYSQMKQQIYQDLCDFQAMLKKFNFIKFLQKGGENNHFKGKKNIQKLIKNIKWRTNDTQKYLLTLMRSQIYSVSRLLITIDSFLQIYQEIGK